MPRNIYPDQQESVVEVAEEDSASQDEDRLSKARRRGANFAMQLRYSSTTGGWEVAETHTSNDLPQEVGFDERNQSVEDPRRAWREIPEQLLRSAFGRAGLF